MEDEIQDSVEMGWDDEALKKRLDMALQKIDPEKDSENDPFATDALGHDPVEEDDSGSM